MTKPVSQKTLELRAKVQVDPEFEWLWNEGMYWGFCPNHGSETYYIQAQRHHPTYPYQRLHRVIYQLSNELTLTRDQLIDHKNLNTLDNRLLNLRLADPSQNKCNSRKYITNTSGYKGVTFRSDGKWRARVMINYRMVNLGNFQTAVEAAKAYDRAALQYHGEFARLNFPVA